MAMLGKPFNFSQSWSKLMRAAKDFCRLGGLFPYMRRLLYFVEIRPGDAVHSRPVDNAFKTNLNGFNVIFFIFRMKIHFDHVLYARLLVIYIRKIPTTQGKQVFLFASF